MDGWMNDHFMPYCILGLHNGVEPDRGTGKSKEKERETRQR